MAVHVLWECFLTFESAAVIHSCSGWIDESEDVTGSMLFSEGNGSWREVPGWAHFLIRLGVKFPPDNMKTRRICLVSMPCDSTAAGLVALGAMARRMAEDNANDIHLHYDRILESAQRNENRTFRQVGRSGTYIAVYDQGMLWMRKNNDRRCTTVMVNPERCLNYHFDGEPPPKVHQGDRLPFHGLYSSLTGESVRNSNLLSSDSAICLSGRVLGGESTRRMLQNVRFKNGEYIVDLSRLLTVSSWTPGRVSRITLFNSRTEKMDRPGNSKLVVADGDQAFLKSLDHFRGSNVIGVIHRCVERDRLEMVGQKLESLAQWYLEDEVFPGTMPGLPHGIFVKFLQRSA